MRVEVFTAVSVFQDLRAEWCQFLSQLPFQSVFLPHSGRKRGGVTLAPTGNYIC